MVVGHLALALAAKRSAPAVNLGWFVAAVITADLLWPIFLLTGLETTRVVPGATAYAPLVFDSYPLSHSVVMLLVWGVALALIARSRGVRGAALPVLAALVVSHWLLDFVAHGPDLPLWPGSPRFGLGLWRSLPATLLIEGAIWVAAIAFYLRTRPTQAPATGPAFWSFVLFSTLLWVATPWSPLPQSARGLGTFALIGWLLVPWAAAADRRQTPELRYRHRPAAVPDGS